MSLHGFLVAHIVSISSYVKRASNGVGGNQITDNYPALTWESQPIGIGAPLRYLPLGKNGARQNQKHWSFFDRALNQCYRTVECRQSPTRTPIKRRAASSPTPKGVMLCLECSLNTGSHVKQLRSYLHPTQGQVTTKPFFGWGRR